MSCECGASRSLAVRNEIPSAGMDVDGAGIVVFRRPNMVFSGE
jgi:hypothetical protein